MILYFFEFGAAPGPIYSYLISPPIIWEAERLSEKERKNKATRNFFIPLIKANSRHKNTEKRCPVQAIVTAGS
jgi:hypothetical protein